MSSSELPSAKFDPDKSYSHADLIRATAEGAESERQRLAKTLHDTVCQSLTGAYFHAQVVMKKIERTCPDEAQELAELADMIHRAVGELGDISRRLAIGERGHPPGPV